MVSPGSVARLARSGPQKGQSATPGWAGIEWISHRSAQFATGGYARRRRADSSGWIGRRFCTMSPCRCRKKPPIACADRAHSRACFSSSHPSLHAKHSSSDGPLGSYYTALSVYPAPWVGYLEQTLLRVTQGCEACSHIPRRLCRIEATQPSVHPEAGPPRYA